MGCKISLNAAARVAPELAVFRPALPLAPVVGLYGAAMKKTYFEKLKDPRWQKRRLEALEVAGWCCARCCDAESTLHVHHKIYIKGKEPWDYDKDQLAVLCEECHGVEHDNTMFLDVVSRVPIDGSPLSDEFFTFLIAGALGLEVPHQGVWSKRVYELGAGLHERVLEISHSIRQEQGFKFDGDETL